MANAGEPPILRMTNKTKGDIPIGRAMELLDADQSRPAIPSNARLLRIRPSSVLGREPPDPSRLLEALKRATEP